MKMAEIAGLVAGVAGLIAVLGPLVEAKASFQRGRNCSTDFHSYTLKAELTLVRFQRWAEAVQATTREEIIRACPQLERPEAARAVAEASSAIQKLCRDVGQMKKKYGIAPSPEPQTTEVATGPVRTWSEQGSDARIVGGRPGLMNRVKWALWDSREMANLVGKVEDFTRLLEDLIPIRVMSERRAHTISNATSKGASSSRPLISDDGCNHISPLSLSDLGASHLLLPETAPSPGGTGSLGYPARISASRDPLRPVIPASSRSRVANCPSSADLTPSHTKGWAAGTSTHLAGDHGGAPRRHSTLRAATSSIRDFQSPATAIAVDQCSNRIGYLLSNQVVLYAIQREADVILLERVGLQHLPAVWASRQGTPRWEGLCLAGLYLAAWGRCQEDSSFTVGRNSPFLLWHHAVPELPTCLRYSMYAQLLIGKNSDRFMSRKSSKTPHRTPCGFALWT